MLPSIIRKRFKGRKGFTLAEVLIAIMIGTMVVASAWSVYVMVWQWWAEMSPRLDVERFARVALLNTTEGVTSISGLGDVVNETYTVGSTTYKYRSGIAWATAYPTISLDKKTITYCLVKESSNTRQFYYGTYIEDNIEKGAIFYKHTNNTVYKLKPALYWPDDTTSIKFEKFEGADNIIKVTVTASKEVKGTRKEPYTVSVTYTDTVYLRNAL